MLYRLLVKQAKTYGEKIAVAGEQRSLTFKELSEEVTATAAYFQACGARISIPPSLSIWPAFRRGRSNLRGISNRSPG